MIGGMLAASVLAIFLIPVSFYVVEKLAGRNRVVAATTPPVSPVPVGHLPEQT